MLTAEDERKLIEARAAYDFAQRAALEWKLVVVDMVAKSSFREVARVTGLSTHTLQRWKRQVEAWGANHGEAAPRVRS